MNRKFLSDDNIFLRPVEPKDVDFMWRVESDSTQWIQNSMLAPLSKENLVQYALNYDADPYRAGQLRLIVSKKNDISDKIEDIGIADLFNISPQNLTAKIGIYILPEFRDGGMGLRTLNLLEDYSRCLLNLRSLCAEIVDCNSASIMLFQKAGYKYIGSLADWLLTAGKTFSLQIYQKNLYASN